MIRVRFAPSPTGYLHVGGARTALFNWLYARKHGGAFVLRIEDTDAERSSWDMVAGIVDGLRWLGLDWDEGPDVGGPHAPYFQSQRLDGHRALAEELVARGRAYLCYCTPGEIQERRQAAEAAGGGWKYDRACCMRSSEEVRELERRGAPRAIRFRVPEGVTAFTDLVHGPIAFDNSNVEDFVILRSDGQPTYHLSVVADDIDMAITHVVRGDDHISNTPKHVMLFTAFGRSVPAFAHVPLILGTDKKRLSKRHGATSVTEYRRLGYLPEAMFNFLALLGWSPGDDRELFTREELIETFSLEGISGGNAVFNPEKLDWVNSQHLMRMPATEIAARLRPLLEDEGLWRPAFDNDERGWLLQLVELFRPRMKRLAGFAEDARPFLAHTVVVDDAAARKHLYRADVGAPLAKLREALLSLPSFDRESLERVLNEIAAGHGLKPAVLIHAVRVAVTGRAVSPGLYETLELLGRSRVLDRLAEACAAVERHASRGTSASTPG